MKKLLFGLSLATLASIASAEGTLTGVEWTKVGDGLQVKVTGDDLAQPKVIRLLNGKSFMLEFDARLAGKAQTHKVNYGGVSTVNAYWFQARPAKVRVQIKLDGESKIDLNEVNGDWMVDINAGSFTSVENVHIAKPNQLHETIINPLPAPVANFAEKRAEENSKLLSKKSSDNDEMAKAVALLSLPDGTPIPGNNAAANNHKKAEAKAENKKPVVVNETYTPSQRSGRGVDLQFENTDVGLVLKTLAMQTGSNIVTANDVKGTITVSLQNVSVEEALSLITSLSGLHYAKRGNTWIVAGTTEGIRRLSAASVNSETRVVPIYSGEGTQIKAAVLKSIPVDTSGAFEMVLPSEQIAISQTDQVGDVGAAGGNAGGNAGAAGGGVQVQQSTAQSGGGQAAKKDTYVVVIGPANRLDAIEHHIKTIDRGICNALGIEVPAGTGMVRQSYFPKGTKAAFLLQALVGKPESQTFGRVGTVEVSATPITSISDQVLTFWGRENEVRRLIENAMALDQVGENNSDFLTYDLKFTDPRAAKQELETQFPGVQVSILPSTASTPNLFTEKETSQSASGGNASSSTSSGSTATTGEVTTEIVNNDSLSLPFAPYEKTAFPMKLVLRGNRDNLARAMRYLSTVDVSPKQVALELRVMDLSREDARKIGLDWTLLTGGTVSSLRVSNGNGAVAGADGTAAGNLGFPGGGALNILASLDDSNNNRRLIARPNLLALDGRQSEIFVGDVIRYIEQVQASQNGITVTTKDLSVGVRFSVLPRIGGDGKITLDMRPVVSSLTGFTPVPNGGSLPQTSLRVAQQTSVINDGETIAIGGLVQKRDIKSMGGIPFLKDLPIIGRLFSRETTTKQQTEVVFFLSAKIVDKNTVKNAADPTTNGNYVEPKKEDKKKGGN